MPYTNLDTDLLRTFAIAAETGNFGRAAALVGRTASAISLQIDRLEQLAGHKLFRRGGRSFALTAAGEQLLLYAHRILAVNDEAVRVLLIARNRCSEWCASVGRGRRPHRFKRVFLTTIRRANQSRLYFSSDR